MKRFLTLFLVASFTVAPLAAQSAEDQYGKLERDVEYMQSRVDSLNMLIKAARQRYADPRVVKRGEYFQLRERGM